MIAGRRSFGLLLAAHGERRTDADNAGVVRLAKSLADKGVAAEIGFGFLKGSPPVDEAIGALLSRDVVVYPLFLSDGYFTRVVLPRLVEQAMQRDATRTISIVPPLGLEPTLAGVISDEAVAAAYSLGNVPAKTAIVLLAHGSKTDQASRMAAELLADCAEELAANEADLGMRNDPLSDKVLQHLATWSRAHPELVSRVRMP